MLSKLSGTHITIMVCVTVLAAAGLIHEGRVNVPADFVEKVGALLSGFVAGWLGFKRPGDTKKDPPPPPPHSDGSVDVNVEVPRAQ